MLCGRWCFKGRSDLAAAQTCIGRRNMPIGKKARDNLQRIARGLHPNPRWAGPLEFAEPWDEVQAALEGAPAWTPPAVDQAT